MKILTIGDFHGKFPEKLRRLAKDVDLIISVGDHTGISEWRKIIFAQLKAIKEGIKPPRPEEILGKKEFKRLLEKDFQRGKFVLKELNKLNKKVILIFGNSDDEWYKYPFDKKTNSLKKRTQTIIKSLKNLHVITYSLLKLKDIQFIGFGGYMDVDSYFEKKAMKGISKERRLRIIRRREKSKKKFLSLLARSKRKKIFILHYPPAGVFDIISDEKDNPMNNKSAGIKFFAEAIRKHKPLFVLCGHMHEYQGMKKLHDVPIINPGAAVDGKAAIIDFDEEKGKIRNVKFVR
jgi:Icc-related predicted phosphoesterase